MKSLAVLFFVSTTVALVHGATTTNYDSIPRPQRGQDYIDGTYEANARVMPEMCPSSGACSMMDSGWPSKGFSCPQKADSYGVPDYSFLTAQETAMVYGGGDEISAKEWPKSCALPRKGSKMMRYSNGTRAWSAIYSITPTCNCPQGVEPKCTRANGLSKETCNIAVLKFCEVRSGSQVCAPKR
ncbi:Mitochondrial carrier protein ymc2 [Puccinia graminis f. sp. tritici]|uniref:Mitochondrial carrier protein ymc2 n=1 Tax=Puccinia graminis f. sp. tritici TaxID=56615 RepID=A0A5B0SAS4_PUCGR|nr:Mitochondrial carrier protein ymc2 [Puccinia graminis f. sp. tritici]